MPSGLLSSAAGYCKAAKTLRKVVQEEIADVHYRYHDRAGLTTTIEGAETTAFFGLFGEVVRVVDPRGDSSDFDFQNLFGESQLATASNSDGTSITIESNEFGQIEQITSPLGHTTQFAYDEFRRVNLFTDPRGNRTRVFRNDEGLVATMIFEVRIPA